MNIIVFGASGKVGSLVVAEALRRGHSVTAFVHSREPKPTERLTVAKGDIYDRASVETALLGNDVIISALGSWGTKDKNVLSSAMQKIVPAAEKAGIRRLVSLTGNVAAAPGEKDGISQKIVRAVFNMVAPKILRDGEDHIRILSESTLSWSVIRSSVMTSGSDKAYQLGLTSASLSITRQAVAQALVNLAEDNEWERAAPFIRRA